MWLGVQLLDDEQSVDARAGAHLDLENGIPVGTGGRAWVRLLTDATGTDAPSSATTHAPVRCRSTGTDRAGATARSAVGRSYP